MGAKIKVGTCGYGRYQPPRDWKKNFKSRLHAYSDIFEVVEINKTFYKLPMVETLKRWWEEVSPDFEFTLKAWQALTHQTSSPTWRGKKTGLTPIQMKNFGMLRPNKEVIESWNETKDRGEALQANICVLQTPRSFRCSLENEKNMRQLLSKINRGRLNLAWEPRGDWNENPDTIKKICDDLNLIHIVDLMRRNPLSSHPIAYIRLHGLNPGEYDYNYDYSRDELLELAGKLKVLVQEKETIYCFFNNYAMFKNAQQLKKLLKKN